MGEPPKNSWQQIKFTIPKESVDVYSDFLTEYGALSVTYQDALDVPLFEPKPNEMPLWDSVQIIGLFKSTTKTQPIFEQLKPQLSDASLASLTLEELTDQNWERAWLKYFKPMQFGKNLWIIPDGFSEKPEAINILLDPGLAFGTGSHPTTALCLDWLSDNPPINKTVIDYGCGSGILAIAAALLGAKKTIGTDIDPQALIATANNSLKNKVVVAGFLVDEDLELPKTEILLANILATPLIQLASIFAELIEPQGVLVMSGLLSTQSELVCDAYADWFVFEPPEIKDDWVRLVGVRV